MTQSDQTPGPRRPPSRTVLVIALILTLMAMLGVGYLIASLTLP